MGFRSVWHDFLFIHLQRLATTDTNHHFLGCQTGEPNSHQRREVRRGMLKEEHWWNILAESCRRLAIKSQLMKSHSLRHIRMESHQPEPSRQEESLKRQQQMSTEGENSLNTPVKKRSLKPLMNTSSQRWLTLKLNYTSSLIVLKNCVCWIIAGINPPPARWPFTSHHNNP